MDLMNFIEMEENPFFKKLVDNLNYTFKLKI
jgi:hypothetical protein